MICTFQCKPPLQLTWRRPTIAVEIQVTWSSGALGPAASSLLQSKMPQTSTRSQGCQCKKQHLISRCMTLSKDMSVISSWPISQPLWLLLCLGHLHSTWGDALRENKKKLSANMTEASYRDQSCGHQHPPNLHTKRQEDLTQDPTTGKSTLPQTWELLL